MSKQELTANQEELTDATTSYDYWVITSALSLALAAEDVNTYGLEKNVPQAEDTLLRYLAPIVEDTEQSLPQFLSPERPEAPAEDTVDTARLVRALYGAATDLTVYVDASEVDATVLVVGEKAHVPNRYLVSTTEVSAQDLTAKTKDDLTRLYNSINEKLRHGV